MTSYGFHHPQEAKLDVNENLWSTNAINSKTILSSTSNLFVNKRKSGERRGTKRRRSHISNQNINFVSDSRDHCPEAAIKKPFPSNQSKMHLEDHNLFLQSAITNGEYNIIGKFLEMFCVFI